MASSKCSDLITIRDQVGAAVGHSLADGWSPKMIAYLTGAALTTARQWIRREWIASEKIKDRGQMRFVTATSDLDTFLRAPRYWTTIDPERAPTDELRAILARRRTQVILTTEDVAKRYDVSRESVLLWVREGKVIPTGHHQANGYAFIYADFEDFVVPSKRPRKLSKPRTLISAKEQEHIRVMLRTNRSIPTIAKKLGRNPSAIRKIVERNNLRPRPYTRKPNDSAELGAKAS